MRYYKTILVLICHILLLTGYNAAQAPRITYLGIEQGLSNNSVTSIFQDHNGFMWFGTFDGLNRYDGHTFTVYRNKLDDSTSLSANRIVAMEEDKRGNIWVGTKRGISIIHHTAAGFTSVWFTRYHSTRREQLVTPVKDIKTDAAGNVFIATDGEGLLVAGAGSLEARQIPVGSGAGQEVQYSVQGIAIDRQQRVWVLLNGKGICRYDYKSGSLQVINDSINTANCVEAWNDHFLWIGAADGLHQYDIAHNSFTAHIGEGAHGLSAARVIQLCTDQANNLWIATDGGGVNILNATSGQLTYLMAGTGANTLVSSAIYSVYADAQGRQWIGTLRGGINVIDPRKSRFTTISRNTKGGNGLVNDFVLSFAEEPSGNLWIGTDGGGLSYWNRKLDTYTNYIHQANDPASLSNNFITGICYDSYGQVWIATYGGGINRFDRSTGRFTHFDCHNSSGGITPDVWVLYEDRARNLWAGTVAGSLNRLNRATNTFEAFHKDIRDVLTLAEDKNGILWAGNFNNLLRIDPASHQFEAYRVNMPVRSISIEPAGGLWLATEGYGLLRFVPGKKGFESFSTEKGLINPSALAILDDGKGSLWVSTFGGLAKFDKAKHTFENYDETDGLQSNQFNYNAAVHLSTGEFGFGGIKGFNLFYPDSIRHSASAPPILLTGIRVNNKAVYQGSAGASRADADRIYALRLSYNQANLSFDMAALEYPNAEKIRYAYFLEGWDQHWNYVNNQRSGVYSNLREGNYTLKIKSTNFNGDWGPEQTVLEIKVLPPWYRSWWAFSLYILLAAAGIIRYQRYRAHQARLKYEVALAHLNAEKERAELARERTEKEMTLAQYEKEKAERETERVINEREKEINEKRLSFFTNISHEFRTPLTLIINPLQDLLARHRKGDDAKELHIINRNARRLLSLIDQLLLFRKTDKAADALTLTRFPFFDLCRDVYLYFMHEARTKHITYELIGGEAGMELYGDRNKIEIILYNLISNAFKYTPAGGSIALTIRETDMEITISVQDTGCGIPAAAGQKIFDRFYQAEGHAKAGFGIGLYLVKQFTDQHHGHVAFTDAPGGGTVFTLQLLKGKAHFGEHPIAAYVPESNGVEVAAADVEAVEEEPVLPEMPVLTDKKVLLVVDDDSEILNYIADLFAEEFTIHKAVNGQDGLEQARQYVPDLVISDVVMPEMTGIDLCRIMKEDAALNHIPVILLTAMTSQEVQLKGTEQGADDYLTKPFQKDLLVAKVKGVLKNRSNLQHYFYDQVTLQKNHLKVPPEYKQLLEKCIEIVEKHLDDDQFTIQVLAREMGMSHSYLYKRIKLISGQSANAFIRFLRLRKAAELLIGSRCTVNEVAFKVGFSDIKYFRVQFNKLFGMNPSDYVKKYRNVLGESLLVDKRKEA